jgi:hypothetical protein
MRRLVLLCCAACSAGDPPALPDAAEKAAMVDASVDPVTPDSPAMPRMLFESATVGSGSYEPLPAVSCDGLQPMVGVRFTTTQPYTITSLGAQVRAACETCDAHTMFMAVVPLDAVTNLPATVDLSDAIGSGFAEVAYTPTTTLETAPPSTMFAASFELPAGTWGLVVGSNALGVPQVEADLSIDVEPVGAPRYFVYSVDSERWIATQVGDDSRFFVIGY